MLFRPSRYFRGILSSDKSFFGFMSFEYGDQTFLLMSLEDSLRKFWLICFRLSDSLSSYNSIIIPTIHGGHEQSTISTMQNSPVNYLFHTNSDISPWNLHCSMSNHCSLIIALVTSDSMATWGLHQNQTTVILNNGNL